MIKYLMVLLVGACVSTSFTQTINLSVYASKFDSIPLGVVDFQNTGSIALVKDYPATIISDDLSSAGKFSISRFPVRDSVSFVKNRIGIYIEGQYSITGQDIALTCNLKDAATDQLLVTQQYSGDLKSLRTFSHTFSNLIVETITGDRGWFTRKVVFVKDAGKSKNIWSMDYDGFNQKQVTNTSVINIFPAFYDSSTIIWTGFMRGKPDLYKGSVSGGPATIFIYSRYVSTSPSVSAIDGRIAYASSKSGNMEVYVCDADGSNVKQLTNSKSVDTSPCWSPNGYQIAFTSDRSGSPQIYVMDADGANQKRISFEGTYQDSPAWSPKGDKVAYASQHSWKFDIWVSSPDGTNAQAVTTCPGNNEYPTWAPDGSRIMFSSIRGGVSDIYSIRMDGSDLRKTTQLGNVKMPDWSHF